MAKPVRGTTIQGTEGDDELLAGGSGNDSIYGYGGNDRLEGNGGNDTLYGHEGDDILLGGAGDDILAGQEGSDILDGGAGNDTLGWGGFGHETLTGGSGSDRFYSGAWAWDDQQVGTVLITDFESGVDTLDLSRFDADERTTPGIIKGKSTPGNEAFTVVAQTDGVTPGHLVITTGLDAFGQPITIVLGYTNTDPGADVEVYLSGTTGGGAILSGSDILL